MFNQLKAKIMTKEIKFGIESINKFMYYTWNYRLVEYTRYSGSIVYIPEAIAKVNWPSGVEHMIDKWFGACNRTDTPHAYWSTLYGELDSTHRVNLLEWVLENYKGEIKVF